MTDIDDLERALELALNDDLSTKIKLVRIRDPSDPMYFLYEKEKQPKIDIGEIVKTDRRNESHKSSSRVLLSESDRKRFSSDMYVNKIIVPTVDIGGDVLNTSKICEEILRDFRGLSTIVMTRATLAASISFGFYEAFGIEFSHDIDDIQRVSMINKLVGHIIPIMGQTRKPPATGFGPKSKMYANHTPLEDGHVFGYEPVIISTKGDGPGDAGEIIAQGVIVSNKGLNYPVGDPRRLTLGRRAEFEETLCWVLITHVYDFISYDSIGPFPTKKNGEDGYKYISTPGKNLYNHIFLWNEFMDKNTSTLGCGVSRLGFSDTKQTGKDICRRLFPWSIRYAMDYLEWIRARNIENFLIETPMSTGRRAKDREEIPSGMDVRRFLLAELLLVGTPLENIIRGEYAPFPFDAPVVKDGGAGLYERMLLYNQKN